MKKVTYYIDFKDALDYDINTYILKDLFGVIRNNLNECKILKLTTVTKEKDIPTYCIKIMVEDLKELVDFEQDLKSWQLGFNQYEILRTIEDIQSKYI